MEDGDRLIMEDGDRGQIDDGGGIVSALCFEHSFLQIKFNIPRKNKIINPRNGKTYQPQGTTRLGNNRIEKILKPKKN